VRQLAEPVDLSPKRCLPEPVLSGVKALYIPQHHGNTGKVGIASRSGQRAGAVQDSPTLLMDLVMDARHWLCAFLLDTGLQASRATLRLSQVCTRMANEWLAVSSWGAVSPGIARSRLALPFATSATAHGQGVLTRVVFV
jgi:hypothetical protein